MKYNLPDGTSTNDVQVAAKAFIAVKDDWNRMNKRSLIITILFVLIISIPTVLFGSNLLIAIVLGVGEIFILARFFQTLITFLCGEHLSKHLSKAQKLK